MSKSALRKAYYSAAQAIDQTKLSFQSINDYKQIVRLGLEQLNKQGFTLHSVEQLKQKHFDKLVSYWKEIKLSSGTIKNRLSVFRRVAEVSGRAQIIKSNQEYGIDPRSYISSVSKGIYDLDLEKIKDTYIKASLELQREFGLRREESIKFKPHQADISHSIVLQASWTKGGIERQVPITTTSQRDCLERIKVLVDKDMSLIPEDKNYRQQRDTYDYLTHKNGFKNLHGLRHAYAQNRYEILTNKLTNGYGWKSPIQNGPKTSQLNSYERFIDKSVRMMISQELGHSRLNITKSYLK